MYVFNNNNNFFLIIITNFFVYLLVFMVIKILFVTCSFSIMCSLLSKKEKTIDSAPL